jgi:hypothetical protein
LPTFLAPANPNGTNASAYFSVYRLHLLPAKLCQAGLSRVADFSLIEQQEKINNGLSLNLNSKNPFLNPRTGSPALPSPNLVGPQSAPTQQQKSTNPFLAAFETEINSNPTTSTMEVEQPTTAQNLTIGDDAKELFVSLSS